MSFSTTTQAEVKFIFQNSSPFSEAASENPDISRFSGVARLSGTFEFRWEMRDDEPAFLEMRFHLDEKSRSLLPYIVGEEPASELLVHNRSEAMDLLLEPELVLKIRNKQIVSVRGTAEILVKDLFTAADCNQRAYVVSFVDGTASLVEK